MDNSTKVSVVIPTYNRCGTILKSVSSVLEQSYENLECIVVDDCSEDGTEDIIRGIKDERLIYIKNGIRLGAAKSRNIGCRYASGSIIGFNDSDDIWKKQKLSIQLSTLSENDNYGMVYCPYLHSLGEITRRMPSSEISVELLSGWLFDFLIEGNVIGTPSMLIKKSCFISVGGFDEELDALEDYDFALRVSKEYEIGYSDECLVHAYCLDKGVGSHYINVLDACIKIIDKFKCNNKKNGLLSLYLNYMPLIDDCTLKKQLVNRMRLISATDRVYMDYALEMSERRRWEIKKEQMLISLIKIADYTDIWNKYFRGMSAERVAIYGCGNLGQVLAKQLVKADICFWGIIDRQVIECKDIPIYNTTNIPEEIDIIVITVYDPCLKDELARKTKAKLVRLNDVFDLPEY